MEPKWNEHWWAFTYDIILNVMSDKEDQEPIIIEDCHRKWLTKMERCNRTKIKFAY